MTERRVLIVEDEMIVALELKETLNKLGYTVVATVDNGYDAIKKAGRLLPDVVLMDIRIRGDMDGIETAERLLSLYDVPVIYLTAHSDNETLRKAISTPLAGYLVKPVNERALYSNIEMAIHKHKLRKTMEGGESAPGGRQEGGEVRPGAAAFGQEVLDALKDPVFVVDRSLRLVLYNSAFSALCRMLGKTAVRNSQPLHDLLPPSIVGAEEEYDGVFSSGKPKTTEKMLNTQDKSIFIVIEQIPTFSGPEVRHVMGIVHDVYQEKASQMKSKIIESGFQAISDDFDEIERLHAEMKTPLHEIRKLANSQQALLSRKIALDEISAHTETLIGLYSEIEDIYRQLEKNIAAVAPERS